MARDCSAVPLRHKPLADYLVLIRLPQGRSQTTAQISLKC
jgi:hypothetical protein